MKVTTGTNGGRRPNILILCMDQWQTHMKLPKDVKLPAIDRLEAQGLTFERHYCTDPICTPSRATMWTGLHAKLVGLWDNNNFAWIDGLPDDVITIGHMLRDQGYYTCFKGKWHIADVPMGEDGLERFGFSDFQGWGDSYGPPLGGAQDDCSVAFEAVDWLEHRAPQLNQPWMLVSSLVNPHDIMFLETDPIEVPHPNGSIAGMKTPVQRTSWFQREWDVELPFNFHDDYRLQPPAVPHYKRFIDLNYGRIPDDRIDLWLKRRNYMINAMRMVDAEFARILEALDRQNLWQNTIVILTSDHGDMNGAHRMTQKGGIHFDEAAIVNMTVCIPGGAQGQRSSAVGSHLDLAPTLLGFAGLSQEEISKKYPKLKGFSLKDAWLDPKNDGPRGSMKAPGRGALFTWDGLHQLDTDWDVTGALNELTNLTTAPADPKEIRERRMKDVGRKYGAPDFSRRTFFRTIMDGRYKFVRWFSPKEYGNPATLDELQLTSDVTLHDLKKDPGELENIANPEHPEYDVELVEGLISKLHGLVAEEIGEDVRPFDLNLFGTEEVKYTKTGEGKSDVA